MNPLEVLLAYGAVASDQSDASLELLAELAESGAGTGVTLLLAGGFVVKGDLASRRTWAQHVDESLEDAFTRAAESGESDISAEQWEAVRKLAFEIYGQQERVAHREKLSDKRWEQVPDKARSENGLDFSALSDDLAADLIRLESPHSAFTLVNATVAQGTFGGATEVGMLRVLVSQISSWWLGR